MVKPAAHNGLDSGSTPDSPTIWNIFMVPIQQKKVQPEKILVILDMVDALCQSWPATGQAAVDKQLQDILDIYDAVDALLSDRERAIWEARKRRDARQAAK